MIFQEGLHKNINFEKKSMHRYKETFKTWNQIAHLYQEQFMDLDLYNNSYDIFCNLLKKQPTILEIGCGPGNIPRYIISKIQDALFYQLFSV